LLSLAVDTPKEFRSQQRKQSFGEPTQSLSPRIPRAQSGELPPLQPSPQSVATQQESSAKQVETTAETSLGSTTSLPSATSSYQPTSTLPVFSSPSIFSTPAAPFFSSKELIPPIVSPSTMTTTLADSKSEETGVSKKREMEDASLLLAQALKKSRSNESTT
jgi:hypothetical protein